MKAKIRRRRTPSGDLAEGWIVTRPAFGFGSTSVTVKESWEAARDSLTNNLGVGPAVVQLRAQFDVGMTSKGGRRFVRPRRIEVSG